MKPKFLKTEIWNNWVESTAEDGTHSYMVGGKELHPEMVRSIRRHRK